METLEGRVSILAALEARSRKIEVILLRHGLHVDTDEMRPLLQLARELNVPLKYATAEDLNSMAHGATHGGVIARVHAKARWTLEELEKHLSVRSKPPLLVMLEGVDDARNLGFVIRTAEAMGVDALLIKKHLWDLDATEIARPASGAYERLPLVQVSQIKELLPLKKLGIRFYGCLAKAKRTMHDVRMYKPTLIAIGGEKRGLSGAMRDICDRFITIPTLGGASSLSLSHASAIVIAEAARQRRVKESAVSVEGSGAGVQGSEGPTAGG
jgi:23S rRNA (guanosine2251-2'-O)-methyltransferase